ncbi:cytochrome P460 family protein [Phenylobacterium sp.]|uniref:cytochrome P460 family protein n=1 Tax=Phenylobacterium sp. TaxID=1871053 RepID=UPI002DE2B5D3|nr:cytochrome P460 family protein [Phenylobacterium sp.]
MTISARTALVAASGALSVGLAFAAASRAEAPAAAPRYTADGKMEFPKDYRTWVYLSTGMDMSYSENSGQGPDQHIFDSVFVNRAAYDAFQKTGHWPDKTVMVLEVRKGATKGSINKHGQFQTDRLGAEVHVKDEARFKATGGWAFFGFGDEQPAKMTNPGAGCIRCHEGHAAVDTTFVQFYPMLLPIAKAKNTLSANYLKDEAEGAAVK